MSQTVYDIRLIISGAGIIDIGDQLDQLTVTSGSSDGFDQPQASTLNMSMLGLPTLAGVTYPASWWIGKNIQAQMSYDAAEGRIWQSIFTGQVASASCVAEDTEGLVNIVQLTAYSKLAQWQQFTTNATGFPAVSTIQERVTAALDESQSQTWDGVADSVQWDDITPSWIWDYWDRHFEITPLIGSYVDMTQMGTSALSVEADAAAETGVIQYLQDLAMGSGCWLFEDTYGMLHMYSPASYAVTTYAIDATQLMPGTLTVDNNIYQLNNIITGSNSTSTRSWASLDSINNYGKRPYAFTSKLANVNAIDTLLTQKGISFAVPRTYLTNLSLNLDTFPNSVNIWAQDEPQRYTLTNTPVGYSDPINIYESRGMTLRVTHLHAELDIVIIPKSLIDTLTSWNEVSSTYSWNTYAAALAQWQDIY
jgi:hypothetical protein